VTHTKKEKKNKEMSGEKLCKKFLPARLATPLGY